MDDTYLLINKAQEGNKEALNILISENERLIWSIVKRFNYYSAEREDLFQIGTIGFIKAVKRFDISLGLQLSTYAVPVISGEIKRYIRDNGPIKISRNLKTIYIKYLKLREISYSQKGENLSVKDIAKKMDIDTETLILAINANESLISLDTTFKNDDNKEVNLYEKIENPSSNPENIIDKINLSLAIDKLDNIERKIIKLRYIYNKTQTDVGKIMGLSQVNISRYEKKILKKIRDYIS